MKNCFCPDSLYAANKFEIRIITVVARLSLIILFCQTFFWKYCFTYHKETNVFTLFDEFLFFYINV